MMRTGTVRRRVQQRSVGIILRNVEWNDETEQKDERNSSA